MTQEQKLTAARALVARIPGDADPVTVPEAAEALGLSPSTVRRWVQDGRIEGAIDVSAGSNPQWRIWRDKLARFLAERMK